MTTLQHLIDGAIDELKDQAQHEWDIADLIHEIADWWVPVYTHTLLDIARSDIGLAFYEPELWPGFNGTNTPVNLIAANIYEAIIDALWKQHNTSNFLSYETADDATY